MSNKVSQEEYNKWVHKMYGVLQNDTNVNYTRVLNRCAMVDLKTKNTVFYNSDNDGYGTLECMAKAYSELKGLEIPEVEGVEEIPQPWRAERGNIYYTVDSCGEVLFFTDNMCDPDDMLYNSGNYYKTKERAEEVAYKIKLIFKLERLYDLYCPGFKPNFKDLEEIKCSIYFDHKDNLYRIYKCTSTEDVNGTYFTKEAAEEICRILNINKEIKETLKGENNA